MPDTAPPPQDSVYFNTLLLGKENMDTATSSPQASRAQSRNLSYCERDEMPIDSVYTLSKEGADKSSDKK